MRERFFSFVVPAHNEAMGIGRCLSALGALDYPSQNYEVIVIENGSSDGTYEKAVAFEKENVRVFTTTEKGVSRARNLGITKISEKSEWCISMDADVFLAPTFLKELNAYLEAHPTASYGMPLLTPDTISFKSRLYFWYRNINDRVVKTVDSVHIVRKDLLASARYPEDFHYTEDLQYGVQLRKIGTYFFLPTKSVSCSTRRFDQVGYTRMFFRNFWIGIVYAVSKNAHKGKSWATFR